MHHWLVSTGFVEFPERIRTPSSSDLKENNIEEAIICLLNCYFSSSSSAAFPNDHLIGKQMEINQ